MSERTDAPGPLRRRGPRPLLLHLTLAMLRSSASIGASAPSNAAWPSSKPGSMPPAAEAIAAALRADGSEAGFPAAVLAEALRQDSALVAGIAAYRRHPYARDCRTRRRCGPRAAAGCSTSAHRVRRPVMLFVPSLVNRAYVLDLAPGRSMLRLLAGAGRAAAAARLGLAGGGGAGFTLTDYIAGRLERALAAAAAVAGGPVVLAGYCMGGLLAVAAAGRRPDLVRALALLATPWDFHAAGADAAQALARLLPLLEPALAFGGTLPVDASASAVRDARSRWGWRRNTAASPGSTRGARGRCCSWRWRTG